jgi:hypothetical protein
VAALALVALAAIALSGCARKAAPPATETAAVAPAPVAVRGAPADPELDALEQVAGELDSLIERGGRESLALAAHTDSVAAGTLDAAVAGERWLAWGEPWVARVAALERTLPPMPSPDAPVARRAAHREVRLALYELRLLPSNDPEHLLPLRDDCVRHAANARRALDTARGLLAQARAESLGA